MISETSLRLCPFTWPSVEIHTSTLDVGAAPSTGIVLAPGLSGVGWVSAVVSSRDDGVDEVADRICTAVPVLLTLMVTEPSVVGWGSSSISPTPFLNPGNGAGSL